MYYYIKDGVFTTNKSKMESYIMRGEMKSLLMVVLLNLLFNIKCTNILDYFKKNDILKLSKAQNIKLEKIDTYSICLGLNNFFNHNITQVVKEDLLIVLKEFELIKSLCKTSKKLEKEFIKSLAIQHHFDYIETFYLIKNHEYIRRYIAPQCYTDLK